jgi:hypothetical protein
LSAKKKLVWLLAAWAIIMVCSCIVVFSNYYLGVVQTIIFTVAIIVPGRLIRMYSDYEIKVLGVQFSISDAMVKQVRSKA